MKRFYLIAFFLITVTACASPQETMQPTKTQILPSATPSPTDTPQPSLTPTPTPEPYLLKEGVLLDWDEDAGDYVVAAEGIDSITTTADGEILAVDSAGIPRFVLQDGSWKEVKIDPNYGYIAPKVWGAESLPLVKEWWDGYKEKMPTNEDIKWMTYEDGSRVEMGEIPNLRYASTRTFGVILAEIFDFPDNIDQFGNERMLLTLSPTNPDKIEEAGNITSIRLMDREDSKAVTLKIIGEGGAIKDNLRWNYTEVAYNMSHKDLLRFLQVGLSGENPPLYGCQLAVSMAGTNSDMGSKTKLVSAMYGEEGDGEWEVDYDWPYLASNPQGYGLFAIPESCMTDEMWEVFRTLPNNPVGG